LPVSSRTSRLALAIAAGSALLFAALLTRHPGVHAQSPGQNQLTVYSSQVSYSVPLLDMNGQPYAGLVELLEPLGSVDARADGKKYKLHFTPPGGRALEVQFTAGKDKGKVRGNGYKLPANFVLQNGRGYVPLAVTSELISKLLATDAELHPGPRRLFIGNVQVHYTLELHQGNPSRLLLGFSSPVNPSIATEPGRVRLTFRREPIVSSGPENVPYSDPLITGVNFSEHDGLVELDVTGKAPMMANFADGGKTIIITGAPAPVPAPQEAPPPPAPANPQTTAPPPRPPAAPRFLVLIDPAHGGSDIGAAITPSLPEKDVVLALARRVQHALANRGIAAGLLRNSDIAIALDQRATSANAVRPALYIALHAANTGRGVHVFTALLPAANLSPQGFLPWDTAQAAFLDLSGAVAGSVAAELESRKLPNTTLLAPLRPMNNIAAPAIAVEIAPPAENVDEIASAAYQEQVAQSIAAGVAAVRSKLPEVRP
jgi:N-acetylmuramoyl-L-alanine amidase